MAHPIESEYHLGRGLNGHISPEGPIASFGEKTLYTSPDSLFFPYRRRFFGNKGVKTAPLTDEELAQQINELPNRVQKLKRGVVADLTQLNQASRERETREREEEKRENEAASAAKRFWTGH